MDQIFKILEIIGQAFSSLVKQHKNTNKQKNKGGKKKKIFRWPGKRRKENGERRRTKYEKILG